MQKKKWSKENTIEWERGSQGKSKIFLHHLKGKNRWGKKQQWDQGISIWLSAKFAASTYNQQWLFFKRQLWEYNFCVYAGSKGKFYFFMYDETMSKKGQNDVSMLNHFIENFITETLKTLYILSDNCSSQNKHQTLIHYLYVLAHTEKFSKVIHRYAETDHSFLPCNRSFGLFEKEKGKRERIILPEEWVFLMKNTRLAKIPL